MKLTKTETSQLKGIDIYTDTPLCSVYSDGTMVMFGKIDTQQLKSVCVILENFWLFYNNITV